MLVNTTRAAGVRTAGGAGWGTLGDSTPVRMGEEQGQHAGSILPLAILAGYGGISIADRTQCIKLGLAVAAVIFVEGHLHS